MLIVIGLLGKLCCGQTVCVPPVDTGKHILVTLAKFAGDSPACLGVEPKKLVGAGVGIGAGQ